MAALPNQYKLTLTIGSLAVEYLQSITDDGFAGFLRILRLPPVTELWTGSALESGRQRS